MLFIIQTVAAAAECESKFLGSKKWASYRMCGLHASSVSLLEVCVLSSSVHHEALHPFLKSPVFHPLSFCAVGDCRSTSPPLSGSPFHSGTMNMGCSKLWAAEVSVKILLTDDSCQKNDSECLTWLPSSPPWPLPWLSHSMYLWFNQTHGGTEVASGYRHH